MRKPPLLFVLILLAAFVISGVTLDVLACILWKNWWPILVIVFYSLAPLPNIIFGRCADPNATDAYMDSSSRSFKDTGFFCTGALIFAGLGLPIVLYHATVIALGQLLLSLGGGIITYVSVIVYIHFFHPTKSDDI